MFICLLELPELLQGSIEDARQLLPDHHKSCEVYYVRWILCSGLAADCATDHRALCFGDSPVTALTTQDLILLKVALAPLRTSGWAALYFKALSTSLDSCFSTSLLSDCSHGVPKAGWDKDLSEARKAIQSLLLPKNPTKINQIIRDG